MMRRHACYDDDVEDLEMMAMSFEHMQASRVGVGTALNLKHTKQLQNLQNLYNFTNTYIKLAMKSCKTYKTYKF